MTSKNGKRVSVTFEEKEHCLKLIDDGFTPSTISSIMGVSRTSIYNWKNQQSKIGDFIKFNSKNCYRKRNRKSKFPKIEEDVLKWIQLARIWKFPVTGQLIKEMAQSIAQKNKMRSFCASNGWLEKFTNRNGLRSIRLVGEGASSM